MIQLLLYKVKITIYSIIYNTYIQYIVVVGIFFTFFFFRIFHRWGSRFYTLTTLKTDPMNTLSHSSKISQIYPKTPQKNISHSHSILYRKSLPNLTLQKSQNSNAEISNLTQFPKFIPKSHIYLSQKISTKSNHPIYPTYSLLKRIWLFWFLLHRCYGGILHFTTYLLIYNYTYYIYKLIATTLSLYPK